LTIINLIAKHTTLYHTTRCCGVHFPDRIHCRRTQIDDPTLVRSDCLIPMRAPRISCIILQGVMACTFLTRFIVVEPIIDDPTLVRSEFVLCIYATLNPISSRKPDHGYMLGHKSNLADTIHTVGFGCCDGDGQTMPSPHASGGTSND
jgi:hypothetical protein